MKNKKRGITLVELMVVLALLAIIFFPLVQVFKSFSNAWWAGKARMSVQSDARDAMYWFVKDLKAAYRHSLGSLVPNGGFDVPDLSLTSPPENWESTETGDLPAGIVKISSPSTSGFCIGLGANRIYTSSVTFQLQSGLRYILTGKIWNTGGSSGKIEVTNLAGTTIYASTETEHTTGWEIVTADGTTDGTFLMPTTDDCIIRLSNTAATGIAYFEDISVIPKRTVLVGTTAETWDWEVPKTGELSAGSGYTFLAEVQLEGTYSKTFTRYRIEDTTDSAGQKRYRVWRQKGSELNPFSNWTSIDYNHIAEYLKRLEFGYDVPDTLLSQNGADNGISIKLEFERSAGGSKLQPYSMKTFIYPQSP